MRSITPFAAPQRFARPATGTDLREICDFCSVALRPRHRHRHLLEVACRRILCACDACALRSENSIGGRFKLIPRNTRPLPDFCISDGQWENLALLLTDDPGFDFGLARQSGHRFFYGLDEVKPLKTEVSA